MNELDNHFYETKNVPNKNMNTAQVVHPPRKSMSPLFYFMIPFIVLTSINLFFFCMLVIDLSTIIGFSMTIIGLFLLGLYSLSKWVISGDGKLRERAILVFAIHVIFCIACLFSIFLGSHHIIWKCLMLVWAVVRTKFLWNDIKVLWRADKSINYL